MDREYILLDGAMGTQLAKRLGPGADAQEVALNRPEVLTQIHREYVEAGAKIIYAATLDTNRYNAISHYPPRDTIPAAISAARSAGEGYGVLTALDIGATGKFIGPYGDLSQSEAYEAFSEVVQAGQGADLIVAETIFDLRELRTVLLAATENSNLPVYCTMTFMAGGRSLTGCTLPCFALTAQSLGASAVGLNCSVGPVQMNAMLSELARYTDLPLICKPNAGMPDPITGSFSVGAEEFATLCARTASSGATMLGGCCGTDPTYIRALGERLENAQFAREQKEQTEFIVCSRSHVFDIRKGECAHVFENKEATAALQERDYAALAEAALALDGGALVLDIDLFESPRDVTQAIDELQNLVSMPLIFKSSDTQLLSAALRAYVGRAGVLCRAPDSADAILKYGAVKL